MKCMSKGQAGGLYLPTIWHFGRQFCGTNASGNMNHEDPCKMESQDVALGLVSGSFTWMSHQAQESQGTKNSWRVLECWRRRSLASNAVHLCIRLALDRASTQPVIHGFQVFEAHNCCHGPECGRSG